MKSLAEIINRKPDHGIERAVISIMQLHAHIEQAQEQRTPISPIEVRQLYWDKVEQILKEYEVYKEECRSWGFQ